MKQYLLMHKDKDVCSMYIDDDGHISKVRRNESNIDHFPIGGKMNDMKFFEWWSDRAIPKTRHGAKTALQRLGYTSTSNALVNNLALSLIDCYWIKPIDSNLRFEDVSLFRNDFVDSFGEITLNTSHTIDLKKKTKFDCASSQGELQKKWCIDSDNRRFLIKGNYGNSFQQSLNEIFATRIHETQNFDNYTKYYLADIVVDDNRKGIGCLSYDFCSENIEMISAWELLQSIKTKRNESLYYPLKEVCISNGISENDFDNFVDYEIMTDFLLTNTDRHMNNISVLRDADSLRLLGFAPIYDSGNSMFYDYIFDDLKKVDLHKIKTHSFIESEIKLLKYVVNRNVVDINRLDDISFDIYEKDISERHIRIPYLQDFFKQKINLLKQFQEGRDIWK